MFLAIIDPTSYLEFEREVAFQVSGTYPERSVLNEAGRVVAARTDEPFTHMAGAPRWDLRVTITYRTAPDAIVVGGAFDKAFKAATAKLYPDKARLDAEEARRFSLLEEHWDVIVVPAED